MKIDIIKLKKPIPVFQVFRSINEYTKAEKSFELRKEKIAWKPIESMNGIIRDEIAYLPKAYVDTVKLEACELLLILDDNLALPESILLTREYIHYFKLNKRNKLDIFEIIFNGTQIDLYLKYGYFEIGTPERDDMKLCELYLRKAVEVKINGKTDSSLTGRRARTFKEQSYIFESLGEVHSIALMSENNVKINKQIPENRKVIDLNKSLW
jgi:hypothetical protein